VGLIANTVTAINWNDAKRRVVHSYREWLRSVRHPCYVLSYWRYTAVAIGLTPRNGTRAGMLEKRSEDRDYSSITRGGRLTCDTQAPEVQTMYSLNLPVSALRTKIRQEFERHRYVNQLQTVDVLLFFSHQEYQVCCS
jgi:hypothetical protein